MAAPEAEPRVVAGLETKGLQPAAYWVPVEVVLRWAGNPRINADAVQPVADSIKEFGFGAPLVARVENGRLIAGDTRIQAAALLGMKHVPVRFMDLSAEQAEMLAVADNRLGEIARWDQKRLAEILALRTEQEASVVGFRGDDLTALLALVRPPATPPADEAPTPPPKGKAKSKPGAVYELGPHRLVCGDARDDQAWKALLGKERLQLVWTDPPYGVSYVGGTKDALSIENDDLDPEQLRRLLSASLGAGAKHCKRGAAWYVAAPSGDLFGEFAHVLGREELGIWKHTLVWVKDRFVMGRADYHYRHESILYGWVPGAAHFFVDDRTLDSVLDVPRPGRNAEHPTMKPVELVARCIRNSSKPGWLVGDLFGGSGTTLMACAQEGRVARVLEVDPRYCDVIRRRWTEYAVANKLEPGAGALS